MSKRFLELVKVYGFFIIKEIGWLIFDLLFLKMVNNLYIDESD